MTETSTAAHKQAHGYLSRKINACDLVAPKIISVSKPDITIGRSFDVDVTINAGFISRLHALITVVDANCFITDKSSNGVYLNGNRVTRNLAIPIQNNDIISFGPNTTTDLAYMFRNNSTKCLISDVKLKQQSKEESVIIISDDEDDAGPSNIKRKKRDVSPDKVTLITQNKLLEEKIKELQNEIRLKEEEARQQREDKQMELALKEQEFELRLKMNALTAKTDLQNKLESLTVELRAANHEKMLLQSGIKQMEVSKTKELAMELEREGLEWSLKERNKLCAELTNKLVEVEQQLKHKESEKQSETEDELSKKVSDTVESELQCSICSELFIKAVTLSCAHSFCDYCINEWKKTKKECPMCRKPIVSVVPSLALNNFINQYVGSLPKEVQDRRNETIDERKPPAVVCKQVPRRKRTSNRQLNRREHFEIVTQIMFNDQVRNPTTHRQRTTVSVNPSGVIAETAIQPTTSTTGTTNVTTNPAVVDITTDEDDDYWSSESSFSSSEYSSEWSESDSGIPGAYYGGYGECYRCGRSGHWANGCPY